MATQSKNGKNDKGNSAAHVTTDSVDTRLAKGTPKVSTALTLDWEGVSPEDILKLAQRSVIIEWQRVMREAGSIPAKDTVKVADFRSGKGRPARVVTPDKVLAAASSMDAEALAALVKSLQEKQAAAKKAAKK